MSLRCVGNQLLQTVTSPLLDKASTASASFWVEVNSGNNPANPNGVVIFGDSDSKFSATLSGTGSLHLQWSSNNGQATSVSTCALTLLPGKSYHVAATWQSGLQVYYLNGVTVGTDTKSGSIGVLGDTLGHAYRLGSDQAGTDVTLDQPALWVGYALTALDVTNLRNRTSAPSTIAATSIALAWSLSGTAAAPAKVGDPGLADASTNGLNLSSIVGASPTYLTGDLTYVANPTLSQAVVSPSGRSIVLIAQDGTGLNSGFTSLISPNCVQSLQFIESPIGSAFTLSFGGQTTAPIPVSATPPTNYALWTIPIIAGHSYNLAVTFPTSFYAVLEYCCETINGTSVVAREVLTCGGNGVSNANNQVGGLNSTPIPGFTDPGLAYADGNPIPWQTIATGIVAAGTTLNVRLTGGPANAGNAWGMYIDGLRVQDTTANTITYYDDASANLQCFPSGNSSTQTGLAFAYEETYTRLEYISGIGPIVTITPGNSTAALVLQTALQSLSTIGSGNVSVTDLTPNGGTGDYQITWTGSFSGGEQSLLTASDSSVVIAQVNAGGVFPTLTLGGSTVPLPNWIWTETTPLPFAFCPLPQSAPAVQTHSVGNLPFYTTGSTYPFFDDATLSGGPVFLFNSEATAGFKFEELPAGTYQVAITYPAGEFTANVFISGNFVPTSTAQFLLQDGNGTTLETYSVNQSVAPSSYATTETAPNQLTPATMTVNWHVLGSITTNSTSTLSLVMTTGGISTATGGAPQLVAILDGIQLTRTSADNSVVVGSGESPTINIPAGWATCQAGVIPAMSAFSVAPPSPNAVLPVFASTAKTMEIGQNVLASSYYGTFASHSNIAYLMAPTSTGQTNSDGYPTTLTVCRDGSGNVELPANETLVIVGGGSNQAVGDPWQGTFLVPPGKYCMTWDGDSGNAVALASFYPGTTVTDITGNASPPTGARSNWRIYQIQFDPNQAARPGLRLILQSTTPDPADSTGDTYLINLTNLAIYPPDPSDPTGNTVWGLNPTTNVFTAPPKFHPWFLNKLQGLQSLRYLGQLNTNNNPTSELSHYKPVTHSNRTSPTIANKTMTVARIQAPASPYFAVNNSIVEIQITTTAPHGLYDSCMIQFSDCGTVEFSGGSLVLDSNTSNVYGIVHVIDNLNLSCYATGGNGQAMTNVLTGGSGTIFAPNFGTIWPLLDLTDLAAAIPTVTSIHFNASIGLDTSTGGGAYQVAAFMAENLPSGVKLHVEPGNECWNYDFLTHQWCSMMNARLGNPDSTDYEAYYASQANAILNQFAAAFTASGRPNDLVRIFGGFASDPYVTGSVLQEAQKIGAQIDEVCVDGYWFNWPQQGYTADQLPIYATMTPDQLLDYLELISVYGGYPQAHIGANVAELAQWGYSGTKIIVYEGSGDVMVPIDPVGQYYNPPGNTPSYTLRQTAVKRHPRIYGITLQFLQAYQNAGVARWNHFDLGGATDQHGWAVWESGNQQLGTGNVATDTINANTPMAKNFVLAEVGGAISRWAGLVPPSTARTTTTTTTMKMVAGRNGMIRAIGFPGGTFRLNHSR